MCKLHPFETKPAWRESAYILTEARRKGQSFLLARDIGNEMGHTRGKEHYYLFLCFASLLESSNGFKAVFC